VDPPHANLFVVVLITRLEGGAWPLFFCRPFAPVFVILANNFSDLSWPLAPHTFLLLYHPSAQNASSDWPIPNPLFCPSVWRTFQWYDHNFNDTGSVGFGLHWGSWGSFER